MAAYGWITRKFIRYGEVINEHLALGAITATKIAAGAIDGTKIATLTNGVGAGVAVAVTPGVQVVVGMSIADAASAIYNFTLPFKCEVLDAQVIQVGAGNAGNSVTIKNAAGTAITNAMNNATDKGVSRPTTVDHANNTIASGAVVKVDVVKAGGAASVEVYLTIVPIA
jgi:hypothetical protein